MSADLFKKYVVKIRYYNPLYDLSSIGSGVIFKPKPRSNTIYLVTAKHNFFENNNDSFKKHTDIFIDISSASLHLLWEFNLGKEKEIEVKLKNNQLYFLNDANYDIAFAIIDQAEVPEIDINTVQPLEVLDCQNENLEKLNYFSIGYPYGMAANSSIPNMASYRLEYSNEEEQYLATRFLSRTPSVIATGMSTDQYMSGFSGAGVFVKQIEGMACLSHIQFNAAGTNQLYASRLDIVLDEINERINHHFPEDDKISLQSYVILDNEKLDFTEYGDLEFFKEKIKSELPSYRKELKNLFLNKDSVSEKIDSIINEAINENTNNIDQDFIRYLIPYLRNKHNDIINQTKGLSYIYAYLAVFSESHSAATRTSLFKKAISLNPEHQQTFLLQKQKIAGNTDAMKKLAESSLSDTATLYDQLLASEENELIKIKLIEEGLQKINYFNDKSNEELREEYLIKYLDQLEATLTKSMLVQHFYKYIILGDNYEKFNNDKANALYFYQIAIYILEKIPAHENHQEQLEKLKNLSVQIRENHSVNLSEQQDKDAMAEANLILANQEDKELKASVSEVKQMMFAFHEELRNIKAQNQGQSSTLEDLELQINQLSIDQFQKDQIIDFNIYEANKHIDLLEDSTRQIKDYIDNVPKNYDLTINNDFKESINHLIQEQVNQSINNSVTPIIDSINENSKGLIQWIQNFTGSVESSIKIINDLREQDLQISKDALTQLTADLNKNALDKITLFKQEASEFNELIIKKIAALTEVRDFSDEEKKRIINSLEDAQKFFNSSAKTINLRAGNTDIDLGNYIRIIYGDLQGLVEAQNRNFISLARAFLGNNKKQRTDLTQNSITLSPDVTALHSSGKVETEDTLIIENTRKTSNKRKIIMRILMTLLLLILLTLIISGMVVMNSGR